tara:strand:+ start:92 stop:1030 length:939 start_codon:yes stop_codon:yes gene_type:complete
MNKKEIYRLGVATKMNAGATKQEAILGVAEATGKTYATIARSLRKTTKKGDCMDNRLGKRILYIPDTQIKVGSTTEHIRAVARRAVEKRYDIIVLAGDWHDMPSLSVFNSRRDAEGLRVADDIKVGNDALDEFMEIINKIPKKKRPEIHITLGNHSCKVRIERFYKDNPQMTGMIEDSGTAHFESHGIIVHDFLDILEIEGIRFSHYITNPHSLKGSPLGGTADTMLKNAGFSFVMGHQQGLKMAMHYLSDGTRRFGAVCGSFYPHDEDYMSIQANKHFRGVLELNEVRDGGADPCVISLEYLMNAYGDSSE